MFITCLVGSSFFCLNIFVIGMCWTGPSVGFVTGDFSGAIDVKKSRVKELGKNFPRLFIKNIALSWLALRVVPARWVMMA